MCYFWIDFSKSNNMIIGRENELTLLNDLDKTTQAQFVVIYGRRRVGKTFLVREHFKERIVFDFVGSNKERNAQQVINFNSAFETQCAILKKQATNWSEALEQLAKYLKTLPTNKKSIVFFDEFPWLDKPQSGFLGAFEYFWNQHASILKNLIFVASGSVASWIIKNLLNSYGGLHNRVTLSLEIQPFNLNETQQFLLSKKLKFTTYQTLQLYMTTGGIPFYLDRIMASRSAAQAIDKLFFAPNAALRNEFENLYASLFKKPEQYISVIRILAQHHYGLLRSTLVAKSSLPAGGSLNRVLETLEECGFIIKMQPHGKKNKDATYRLIDLFSLFYLKFVDGKAGIKLGTWQSLSEGALYKSWCGYAFENICLWHIPQIQMALGIQGVSIAVSSWNTKATDTTEGAQVDIVIDRKDGITHLCEVKFSNSEFITTDKIKKSWRKKRAIFQHYNQSKNAVVTTFIGTYSPITNIHFNEEVHSFILMDQLYEKVLL